MFSFVYLGLVKVQSFKPFIYPQPLDWTSGVFTSQKKIWMVFFKFRTMVHFKAVTVCLLALAEFRASAALQTTTPGSFDLVSSPQTLIREMFMNLLGSNVM